MSQELQDITTHNLSQPAPATTRYPTGGYFLSFLWRWTFDSMASASRGAKRQRPIFVFDSLGHFFLNEKHLLSGWQSTARCFKESCYNLSSLDWQNIVGVDSAGFFLPLWQSCDRIKKPSQERLIEWHRLRGILLGISKQSLELFKHFKQTCGKCWFKQPLKPRTVEPHKSIWGESRPEDGTLGRKCSSPQFRKLGTEIAQFPQRMATFSPSKESLKNMVVFWGTTMQQVIPLMLQVQCNFVAGSMVCSLRSPAVQRMGFLDLKSSVSVWEFIMCETFGQISGIIGWSDFCIFLLLLGDVKSGKQSNSLRKIKYWIPTKLGYL